MAQCDSDAVFECVFSVHVCVTGFPSLLHSIPTETMAALGM